MPVPLSEYLQRTIDNEITSLRAMSEADASVSHRNGWTPKQELGHLIDSATNNHARFVRITLEDNFKGPSYNPDGWVALHGYANMPWSAIVEFWYTYNQFLAALVGQIPESRMGTVCEVGKSGPMTLRFLIEDYVMHMQHHIDQLFGRERVTQYPQPAAAPHR